MSFSHVSYGPAGPGGLCFFLNLPIFSLTYHYFIMWESSSLREIRKSGQSEAN